jgi:sugar/nucleoside kinase (ribokinase family)
MLTNLKLSRLFSYSNSIAIGGRILDGMGGEMKKDGSYVKSFSSEEKEKLKTAEEVAFKVLKNTGASDIFHGGFMASHVGGLIRIKEHLDQDFQTEFHNLYVCDGSMVPENVRLAPALTLVCLAKYFSSRIMQSF